MATEYRELPALQIPDPGRLVQGRGQDPVAGGEVLCRHDLTFMALQSQEQVPLDDYNASDQVKIRFRLFSDSDGTVGDGWQIDDVVIEERCQCELPYPFFEDFENGLCSWRVSGQDWDLTTSSVWDGIYSVTDSPDQFYVPYSYKAITLDGCIDLTTSVFPVLTFWHKISLADIGDRGYVEISVDGGSTWTTLETFQNISFDWEQQLPIDLSGFKTWTQVKIRFRLVSDSDSSVGDGWYIDDVSISDK